YRSRFPNLPSSPVLNVVQTHGYMGDGASANVSAFDYFKGSRTPTPEEIVVQSWVSMVCGASGLIFGDMPMSGTASGPQNYFIYPDSLYERLEYGMYRSFNPGYSDANPNWRIDSMWLGLRSRNRAIEEVVTDLYHIDSAIGW